MGLFNRVSAGKHQRRQGDPEQQCHARNLRQILHQHTDDTDSTDKI